MVLGELAPQPAPRLVHEMAPDLTVGPRHVYALEDAEGMARAGLDEVSADAVAVRDHDLARLHLADQVGPDHVKGTRFRGEHVRLAVQFPQAERPHSIGIPHRNHAALGENSQGVGARPSRHAGLYRLLHAPNAVRRAGDHAQHHLAVAGGIELLAGRRQLVPQRECVDEIAVVGEGYLSPLPLGHHRLGVGQGRSAGGRVARVPNGEIALQSGQGVLIEDLGHQTHLPEEVDLLAVGYGDSGALLTPMLEREEPEVCQTGYVLPRPPNAEDTTRLARLGRREEQLTCFHCLSCLCPHRSLAAETVGPSAASRRRCGNTSCFEQELLGSCCPAAPSRRGAAYWPISAGIASRQICPNADTSSETRASPST